MTIITKYTLIASNLLQVALVDLIEHPGSLQLVRDEIIQVLRAGGWKNSSLHHMKLLDSAIKESQRLKRGFIARGRLVEADMQLPDGTFFKRGSRIHIDTHRMVDPAIYENPEEWKVDRFLRLRSSPSKEHAAHLVATSTDHMGFGHGIHACPGRFLAAQKLKVALCHLLIKYDWKLVPGTDTQTVNHGVHQRSNPATRLLYRKKETVELDIRLSALNHYYHDNDRDNERARN